MDELANIVDDIKSAAQAAQAKCEKASNVISENADKPLGQAIADVRTELSLSPVQGLRPMYDTKEEAIAASKDKDVENLYHLDEALAKWVSSAFDGVDK